jgi:hypothetical protein
MMNNVTLVLVALLGGGGPLMWFLTRFDRRNTDQHAANMTLLKEIKTDIETIDSRLDKHIDWHLDNK